MGNNHLPRTEFHIGKHALPGGNPPFLGLSQVCRPVCVSWVFVSPTTVAPCFKGIPAVYYRIIPNFPDIPGHSGQNRSPFPMKQALKACVVDLDGDCIN